MTHKPTHPSGKNISASDDAVSSIVGEMLLIVIGLVLAAVFAVSLMNLLPDDRNSIADISMDDRNASNGELYFYHKGGDALVTDELSIFMYLNGTGDKMTLDTNQWNRMAYVDNSGTGHPDSLSGAFDVGTYLKVDVGNVDISGADVRITTVKNLIFSAKVREV